MSLSDPSPDLANGHGLVKWETELRAVCAYRHSSGSGREPLRGDVALASDFKSAFK
jgi:hypothetical protein